MPKRHTRRRRHGGNYTEGEIEVARQLEEIGRDSENEKKVILSGYGLTKIPIPIPKNVIELDISNNKLTELPVLHDGVAVLDAQNNPIANLPDRLPASLEGLNLSNTNIERIPELPAHLFSLNLDGTRVRSLPPLPAELEFLVVSGTALSELPPLPQQMQLLSIKNTSIQKFPNDLPDKMGHLVMTNIQPRAGILPRILESCNMDSKFRVMNTSPVLLLAGLILDNERLISNMDLEMFIRYNARGEHLRGKFVFYGDRMASNFSNTDPSVIKEMDVAADSTNAIGTEIMDGNILALQSTLHNSTDPSQYAIIRPSNMSTNYNRAKTVSRTRTEIRAKKASLLTRKPYNVKKATLRRAKKKD